MILSELNRLLVQVARSSYLVNDSFVGDVYTINGKENRFACFVATPMNAVKESGIIRYTYILYYIDRLTKDEVNIDYVQSDAVSVLKGIIDFLGENGIEVNNGYEFTLFRQQFSDWCAGAYVSVDLSTADNDCSDGGFNLSGNELIPLIVNKNGIYTPGPGTDGYNRVTINVPQVGATEEWVDDEIDTKLTGYATQTWVNSQGYIKTHQDLSDYATKTYVSNKLNEIRTELPDLSDYATKNWVDSQGFLKECNITDYATKTWVESKDYLTQNSLDGYATKTYVGDKLNEIRAELPDFNDYATKTWVDSQGFLKECNITDYATKNWVESKGYLTQNSLDGYATEDYVTRQGYIRSSDIAGLASETWVRQQNYLIGSDLDGYATEDWVRRQDFLTQSDINDYATREWIIAKDYLVQDDLCGLASETWVKNWVTAQEYLRQCDLEPYATKNWVERQGYLTESELDEALKPYATKKWVDDEIDLKLTGYATEEWVSNNYVDKITIQDYATREWVSNNYVDNTVIQDYVTQTKLEQELADYATKTWVEGKGYLTEESISGKLDRTDIWSGTMTEWEALSPEEKCSYLISLIVE